MSRKKDSRPRVPQPKDSWEIITEMTIHGRKVYPGVELKIKGERGRFRFVKYVKTAEHEWLDVWGGPSKAEKFRSFALDRVKTVHYKNKTDASLAAEYKEKQKEKKADG